MRLAIKSRSIGHRIPQLGNGKDNGKYRDKVLQDGFDFFVLPCEDNMAECDVGEHPTEAEEQKRECARLPRPLDKQVNVSARYLCTVNHGFVAVDVGACDEET